MTPNYSFTLPFVYYCVRFLYKNIPYQLGWYSVLSMPFEGLLIGQYTSFRQTKIPTKKNSCSFGWITFLFIVWDKQVQHNALQYKKCYIYSIGKPIEWHNTLPYLLTKVGVTGFEPATTRPPDVYSKPDWATPRFAAAKVIHFFGITKQIRFFFVKTMFLWLFAHNKHKILTF